jgi:hypothetical protein
VKTIVIVYDQSSGEHNRWEDGPVPRKGEYVRGRHGEKLAYPVVAVSYETDGDATVFVSVVVDGHKGVVRPPRA